MATIDFYAVLELPATASEEDVRRAYRRLAVRWHPDKNPDDLSRADTRFKEVAEAYEVLRDPVKRRQYDRVREGRGATRRARPWFGNTDGFGDDLWREPDWGGSGQGWHFSNPFDVFKEFFGDRDPWADLTPRTRRQDPIPRPRSSGAFWSVRSDPFFSAPFSSPFFANRSGSLFDQRGGSAPAGAAQPERISRGVEIKIHGFSDSESEEEEEEEEGEVTVEEKAEDEEVEVLSEEDAALKEAIRLSLDLEEERKRNEQRAAEQTEEDLEEAIRRSLADLEQRGATADDWMEVEADSGGRIESHTSRQRLPALH